MTQKKIFFLSCRPLEQDFTHSVAIVIELASGDDFPLFLFVCVCVCTKCIQLIDDLMVYLPFWDKELLESLSLICPLLLCVYMFGKAPVLLEPTASSLQPEPKPTHCRAALIHQPQLHLLITLWCVCVCVYTCESRRKRWTQWIVFFKEALVN